MTQYFYGGIKKYASLPIVFIRAHHKDVHMRAKLLVG
jgi:hypothetical protein